MASSSRKLRVAIVGATGIAGQQFVVALRDHPWFDLSVLAASERSAGKRYGEALRDAKTGAFRWWCNEAPPAPALELPVVAGERLDAADVDLVFSAVESDVARELEPRWAKACPVISTASAYRYEEDVPLLIPGVNLAHAPLLEVQRRRRGWKGFVAPIPNCTTTGLAIALKPLHERYRRGEGRRDLDAGRLGRRSVAWRGGPRHPRQRRPLHPRRGGEGGARDAQDSRCARRGRDHTGADRGVGDVHARRRPRGSHRGGVGLTRRGLQPGGRRRDASCLRRRGRASYRPRRGA